MNLAEFIEFAKEDILREAAAYASTIESLKHEELRVLRDDLPMVLNAISADLRSPQSRTQSIVKSHGLAHTSAKDQPSAAETHGLLRARSGLQIEQVFAEYRALRSSILRLWSEATQPDPDAVQDVARFNEAIDQALAESVRVYAAEVERWRQLFLGILGHDLRSPLNAISLTAELIAQEAPEGLAPATAILRRSTQRMATLLDSLLDYNRAGLGGGMALARALVDLGALCTDELELQRNAHPNARIRLSVSGDALGEFDASRMREAVGNLVTNAVKHGLPLEPVIVQLEGNKEAVQLSVENAVAQNIPSSEMDQLYEPLHRGTIQRPGSDRTHLGLGLFIARQIARAHGGELNGLCAAHRVRFTMTLPRSPALKEGGQICVRPIW
jgi:signal transduction histidine kinase